MIYILCFFFSTFFIWLGTRRCSNLCMENGKWEKIKFKKVPVIIGLLFPVLLATFRDTTVGSDVEFYVVPYFKNACSMNDFWDYVTYIGGKQSDLAYSVLNFLISRVTDSIGVLFFAVQAIIIIFIFIGFWNIRGRVYPWVGMLFYYLLFYNMSLSTVRQSCALAICFCAICMAFRYSFEKKQIFKVLGLVILAFFFHASAVISVPVLFVCYLFGKKEIKLRPFVVISVALVILFGIFYNQLMQLIILIVSLVNNKYTNEFYLTTVGVDSSGYKSIILIGLVILCLQLLMGKRKNKNWRELNNALIGFNVIYIASMLFLSRISFMPRLLYYIQILWPISLGGVGFVLVRNRKNRILATGILIIIVMAFWFYFYIVGGVHETYPYVFR